MCMDFEFRFGLEGEKSQSATLITLSCVSLLVVMFVAWFSGWLVFGTEV